MATVVNNPCDLNGQIVRSDALKRVMKLVEQVACHPAAVLIVGETGTGKELIARSIHSHSLRCNKPWIDVNCAAIPEHLVESELFGYEKGAFSGADTQKIGYFEMADGGTLFLDEIGDLDPKVQVKLLRVLDGVPYYRLGGNKKVNVDVRVVAATNQNLEDLVRAGRFRNDLYHRLAEFKLEIPPLRERPEDLLAIAEQILHQHYPNSRFTNDAVTALLTHEWAGNVRELRNSVFRAIMLARNAHVEITAADLKLNHAAPLGEGKAPLNRDLDQLERQIVFDTLERVGGNQGKAAEALGISRRTLLRKLKALRELDTVGGSLHRVVSHFAGVANRVQEIRRQRWLATGELHAHLATRLDGDCVVKHLLDFFPRQLMHEADLVRVHKAGIAHHVAAVGKVDGQHRSTAILHGR